MLCGFKARFLQEVQKKASESSCKTILISVDHFFNYWFISFSDFSKFPFPKKKRVLEKAKYFNKKGSVFVTKYPFDCKSFYGTPDAVDIFFFLGNC